MTQGWKGPGSVEPPAPESDGSPFEACDPQNQTCQGPQLSHIPGFLHLNPLLEKPEKRSEQKGAEKKDPGSVEAKKKQSGSEFWRRHSKAMSVSQCSWP